MVTVWAKVRIRTSGGFKIISGDRRSNNSMHGMPPFFLPESQGFSKYLDPLKRACSDPICFTAASPCEIADHARKRNLHDKLGAKRIRY